jgi:hypothetical protein
MRKFYPLGVFVGLLALSACGKKPEEAPVENNEVIEEPANVIAPAPPPEAPVETNSAAPVTNRVAPPEITEEQQMQDDAEATGMTSRLPDDEGQTAVVAAPPR